MTDLIERLRLFEASGPAIPSCQLFGEAADEIERLQREVVTLRWGSEQYNRLADYVIPRKNLWVDHNGSHTDSVIREIKRLTDELINLEQVAKDRYCEMQTEIERLMAVVETQEDALKEFHAEIERLREHYDKHLDDRIEWQAENQRLRAVVDALKQIEVRGLEIINEHVGGSDASYVAQELTSMAHVALENNDG